MMSRWRGLKVGFPKTRRRVKSMSMWIDFFFFGLDILCGVVDIPRQTRAGIRLRDLAGTA